MVTVTRCIIIAWIMFYCEAVTYREQLDHIAKRRRESRGIYSIPSRRQGNSQSVILGAPSMASHLPEAEPILPGHTLIRPARGMLKSSIKFPHLELDNGAGVYGNVNNLGIRYDGRNERVQYSGFRRMPDNLIMAVPKFKYLQPRLSLSSFFELSDRSEEDDTAIKEIKKQRPKLLNGLILKIEPASKKRNDQKTRSHANSRHIHQDPLQILPSSYNENMFEKISTKKPKKKRFRPPAAKPRHIRLESIVDNESLRRDRKFDQDGDSALPFHLPGADNSSSDDYVENPMASEEIKKETENDVKSKMEWFWKSKDAYNNIKINQDAPDITDLIPTVVKEKLRQWWFYHQDDFTPFET